MRQSHLILSNAAVMWMTQVLLLAPQLILVPFLIRTTGDAGYGVYALVWSLVTAIDQLQKSLQSGVVKYSAAFLAQGQLDEVNRIVSSSSIYSLILAILASTGILIASAVYRDPSAQITSSLVVVGITVLITIPLTPYVAVIQSCQRYFVGAIADTASKYLGLIATVCWFHFVRPSVEAPVVIMAAMLFLSRLVQVPVAYILVPGLQNRFRLFDQKGFRLIAAFGAAIVLASVCLVMNSTGVRWMMGLLVSPSFVAHLAIMLMPGLLLSQIIQAMTVTVMPATSAYEATGNQRQLQELLIRGMRYSTLLVVAGIFAAGFLIRNVLTIWVGSEYVFLAPYALALFAGMSFRESTSTGHHMLKGMGKLRTIVIIYFVSLVLAPITLILIVFQIEHDPYLAVTIGLVAGHLVCGGLQIVLCAKAVRANLRGVLTRVYIQPGLVAAAVSLVAVTISSYAGIEGFFWRTAIAGLAIMLFFGASYLFIATSAERQQAAELIQLLLNKVIAFRKILPQDERQ